MIQPGDTVRCVSASGYYRLTEGKEYVTVNGLGPGIFESRPYITVVDDAGKHSTGYAWRFEAVYDPA